MANPNEPPHGDDPEEGGEASIDETDIDEEGPESGEALSHEPIAAEPTAGEPLDDSPEQLRDLSLACVRFVERLVGVRLDYLADTLPLLDHYIRTAAPASAEGLEARELAVLSAGAYFGEVVRRRHPSWWHATPDPADSRIECRHLFLSFSPMDMMRDAFDAFGGDQAEADPAAAFFDVDDDDREVVEARLALLPEVPAEEFYLPSTRLEVLDIVVEAIRVARVKNRDPELNLEPEDYT